MKNPNVRKYYLLLKNLFPRINYAEGKFLHELKLSLNEYEECNINATYEDIIEQFGTPEAVVSDYIANQDPDYVLKCIKIKKLWQSTFFVVLFTMTLGLGIWYFYIKQASEVSSDSVLEYERTIIIEDIEDLEDIEDIEGGK